MPHVLVIDDDALVRETLAEVARDCGYSVAEVDTIRDAMLQLDMQPPDLVLADLGLPDGDGIDVCRSAAALGAEIVVITGQSSTETAVQTLRLGAQDYLIKPVSMDRLEKIFRRVSAAHGCAAVSDQGRFGDMIGESAPMLSVYQQISRVAPSDATVLVIGESGTGKELAARAVHQFSKRRDKPFIAVNCGAIATNLIESEMFGHERGSFTGAERQHKGYFERADGGTLFLDEITEMPADLQVKLLRVLETGRFMRVGTHQELSCDVRVVAATNRRPEEAVREGKLREDLYYRLAVFPLELPPLRARGDDIELLANHFLAGLNAEGGTSNVFSESALAWMKSYEWPGNVRELRNHVRRAYIMADGDEIDASSFPVGLGTDGGGDDANGITLTVGTTLAEADRRLILATLAHCGGIKKRTAETLGVSSKTLYNRLETYTADGYRVPQGGGTDGQDD